MHIREDRVGRAGRSQRLAARTGGAIAAGAALLLALLAGCASPGPPLPPSLKLPEVATDLTATRVGGQVTLRWTTPTHTTDKLLISGPVTAEICRETPAATPAAARPAASGQSLGKIAAAPCAAVVRESVTPGASEAADPLPAELQSGPARLLAYRVQLKNAAGRTAGESAAAFAAAGAAPGPVEELRGTAAKGGVVLEWRRESGGGEAVELERTALVTPAAAASQRMDALPGAGKEPAESRFRAGAAGTVDAGGAVDRTAQLGATYRYTAQRIRTAALGGLALELRSVPSAEVTVAVPGVFPPEAPAGLVAVPGFFHPSDQSSPGTPGFHPSDQSSPGTPGFAGGESEGEARRPAIDLSWDPNMEPRIAGYRVYRRDADGGEWRRLDAEPVRVTAYRDLTVAAGRAYAYRVTAVNEAGMESAPGGEVTETAPGP